MKKFWKYIAMCAVLAGTLSVVSCNDDDNNDPYTVNRAYLYQPYSTFASLEYKANGEFLIDIDNPLKTVPVRLTKPAPGNMNITVDIDPSLVEEYNQANGTNYTFLEGCSVVNSTMTIPAGGYITPDSITVSFGDKKGFQTGATDYILPIAIKNAPGAAISQSSRIFLTFSSNYKANMVTLDDYMQVIDSDVAGWETAYRTLNITDLAKCSWAADDPITFNVAVDPSLVDAYNAANGESYKTINATLAQSTVTIAQGETKGGVTLNVGDYTAGISNDESYCIPLKISNFSGVGAEIKGDVQVVYVILTGFLPSYTVTAASIGSMITNPGTWTAMIDTPWDGTYDCDYILENIDNGNYEYVWDEGLSATITADLGEVQTISQIGLKFYAWYYSTLSYTTFQTSLDGNKWTDWTFEGTWPSSSSRQYLYAHLAKPAKMRYFRVSFGDPSYSSYYGSVLKRIWFYN